MNQYINFDKMITPAIIKVIFWAGVGLSVISGLIMMISGAASPYGGGFMVFTGLMTIILGPLFTRIYCELLILLFKMNEALQSIKSNNETKRFSA
ncbi:DUF4282 domain-containing protein [Rossellomorea vietnamensis]|uniref:DUF4282 domain-containing protein n=1 Tax=Rossellomorea vietnamensis TaxID=218284 RepID=A0A5D4K853_9BACI|nr:DUF4282 domain-containing protein [Rossellomorea vietnamensis]TYR73422.1 DUF4282 domain-containing protein [Rossellomorea vietnamensis]